MNYCKTLEGYIRAKGEMVAALDQQGVLILNADDQNSRKLDLKEYNGRVITIGIHTHCHFKARDIAYCADIFGSEIRANDNYFMDANGQAVLLENMRDYLTDVVGVVFYEAK